MAKARKAAGSPTIEATLREVVATLAVIPDRGSGQPGERVAAGWLADRLRQHGCSDTPENLDYATVASAARLAEAVIRRLARDG